MTPSDGNSSGAITWGELLRSEAMRGVHIPVTAGLDRAVQTVRIISDVEQIRSCLPGTVTVLELPIAGAAWAVAIAVRYAWERNVRCVIAQVDPSAAATITRLAERLSVPVGFYDGDLSDLALQLSAIISAPVATRSLLVAECATRLAEQRTVSGILRVIEEQLPGTRVALLGPRDSLIAGRPLDLSEGGAVVRAPLEPLDFRVGRQLVAVLTRGSVAWADTVASVLKIARAHIVACEASSQIKFAQQVQVERWTLQQVLGHHGSSATHTASADSAEGDTDAAVWTGAREHGWQLDGMLVGAMILRADPNENVDDGFDLALTASWPSRRSEARPVPLGAGWALWEQIPEPDATEPADEDNLHHLRTTAVRALASRLQHHLGQLQLGVDLVAGVGDPAQGPNGLGRTLQQALLAARAARSMGSNPVATFRGLGARAFLAAADTPDLRDVAHNTLSALADAEDRDQLIVTLVAYLENGGSTSRAAERLGVHRNTVTSRVDRIRRFGIPLDDPDRRLELHVACYLITPRGAGPRVLPEVVSPATTAP